MTKSVFLVDDSATMLMSLKGTLEISGFKVETASDGEAALGKLRAGLKPDLIITDINMPRLDGFGVIEGVRASSTHRSIPVLVLTTETGRDLKERAQKAGATGWIVKPFDDTRLIDTINRVLGL